MKKVFYIIFILFFLLGCTPKEYTENLEIGKEALKSEKYDEAVIAFNSAKKEKYTDEVNDLLNLAELMNDSVIAFNKGEFEASIYTAEKVKELKGDSKLEEDTISKANLLIKQSEEAKKALETIQKNITKGKTLLEENKFDEAYTVFEELSKNKELSEVESNSTLKTEVLTLMNDTLNKKKVYQEEQEKKKQEEEKKKLEEEKKRKEAEEKKQQEEELKQQEEANKPLTPEEAIELVKQYIDYDPNPNVHFVYEYDNDHGDYVIHVMEEVIDDPETKEGHYATWGWYAVDPVEKFVYDNMNY